MPRCRVGWFAVPVVVIFGLKAGAPAADAVHIHRSPLAPGKFGSALDARRGYAAAAHRAEYEQPPLTVECWARLESSRGYNLVVANNPKESSTHWEIYTETWRGTFAAYVPGRRPAVIDSGVPVVDHRWHHLAMVYEPDRLRLYIDGKVGTDVRLTAVGGRPLAGPLYIGAYPPHGLMCDGLLDEVRVRRGAHAVQRLPDRAPTADADTIGLWHFDAAEGGRSADASPLRNPAVADATAMPRPARPGPTSPTELDYRPVDTRLRTELIHRSPEESYVTIKLDTVGRIFVGGREALFVFEPDARGGYGRPQELYRFPADSWLAGIEIRGDDVYVLTGSALYLIPGGRIHRTGLRPRRLIWGLPLDLHVSFHCLAWGPEGDLYFNCGDPLLNYGDFSRPDHWGHWTFFCQPEGTRVPYTGVGGVFRCRPDGSHLRVVAQGTRGCFGLAFDRAWNLFTNDNDHESLPHLYTPPRLLHVTPHVDFAWPRGWAASRSPDRADLVEPMLSRPERGVPVGLAYYDEPFLPELRHCLLQDRWDRLEVRRYPLRPRGASFTADDMPLIAGREHARPIGVAVGRGGRVFVTVSYMAQNEHSPHYVSDLAMLTKADDPPGHPFAAYDAPTASEARLWAELSSPSWERRLAAHTEILRRGGPLLTVAARRLAAVRPNDPAILHLPWLAAARHAAETGTLLAALADDEWPDVRLQAVRALAEFPQPGVPRTVFEEALGDRDPHVRLAALAAFFRPGWELPPGVAALACSSDTYLRQTAAKLLAERASLGRLRELAQAKDPATRLAGVLAAGFRLTVPPVHAEPPAAVPIAYDSPNAFLTIHYADATINLRSLGRVGSYTTAEWWKAVPPTGDRQELFELLRARLDDPADAVALQAAYGLSLLRDPRTEPLVARARQAVTERRLSAYPERPVDRVWAVGPFDDRDGGFGRPHPPEQGAIDLTARYPSPRGALAWQELAGHAGRLPVGDRLRAGADDSVYACFRLHSAGREPALLSLATGGGTRVWHNGHVVQPSGAARWNGSTFLLDLQAGSNDLLVRLRPARAAAGLTIHYRARGEVAATLPEKLNFATLAQRLKEARAAGGQDAVGPEFLLDWSKEIRRGNAAEGRRLFGTLGCVKCHAITPDQKGAGAPSLAEAGRRFTVPYLVESVLLPSKQVADIFRSTTIATNGGQVITGLVVNETADSLDLLLPDTTQKSIAKKDVESRTVTNLSPMPAGLVKTPAELRNLLAYLVSENPVPP